MTRRTHPLAGRTQVWFRELWDEPFVAAPVETGWWRDWWLAAGERDGHPARANPVIQDFIRCCLDSKPPERPAHV